MAAVVGCSVLPAVAPPAAADPGAPAPDGAAIAAAAKFSADAVATMQKTIATSKSGGTDPEGLEWMAKLTAEFFSFADTNPNLTMESVRSHAHAGARKSKAIHVHRCIGPLFPQMYWLSKFSPPAAG